MLKPFSPRKASLAAAAAQNALMLTRQDIISLWARKGHVAYQGEGVTQLEHAWQTARAARLAHASGELQLAAWLHDIGHLMTRLDGSPTLQGVDDRHEQIGASALTSLFGAAVGRPVALHVAAKRYLVATRPDYAASLSPDSVRSLALQGGPMVGAECAWFEQQPLARDALRLRAWDDQAKRPELKPASGQAALGELAALMAAVTR